MADELCADGGSRRRRGGWRGRGLTAAMVALPLVACSSTGGDPARRQRYEADKAHCTSISADEAAQRSCMTYRGWRDGKFR